LYFSGIRKNLQELSLAGSSQIARHLTVGYKYLEYIISLLNTCERDAMINTDTKLHENESIKEYLNKIVEEKWRKSIPGRIAQLLKCLRK